MPSLWKFAGLTPLKLTRLAMNKTGEDELSTRSASLSYYFVLSLFPLFLFLLSLIGVIGMHGTLLRDRLISTLGRLAPGPASQLVEGVVHQTFHASSGLKLAAGVLGALWAASGGMGAVITSLNVIHRIQETRPWWKQKATVVLLTLGLALLMIVALMLALYGEKLGLLLAAQVGLSKAFTVAWRVVQWPASFAAMFLSYSLVYYFGPDLQERKWYWVTPGAALGVGLWLVASVGFRIYLHFFNSYSATYGSLGAVIILLLWLYITGFAILIGSELNWVIEDADKSRAAFETKKRRIADKMEVA
jgi:membrane protein